MSASILTNLETAIGSLGRIGQPVTLGGLLLNGFEVPDVLRVGGQQSLVVHKLPGGQRVLQSMGDDPAQLTMAGKFVGPSAATRARQFEAMRKSGQQVTLSAAGISVQAVVASFSYDFQLQGAVVPYQLTVEIVTQVALSSSLSSSSLSSLVGSDLGSAITSVSTTLSSVSAYATSVLGTVSSVTGQITPIANLVGAGGLLAGVQDKLTVASGVTTAGVNFAAAPAAAASLVGGLQDAGSSLMGVISGAGSNLIGISLAAPPGSLMSDARSLAAAMANAGALAAAVTTGGYVNRTLDNAALSTGATPLLPIVHS